MPQEKEAPPPPPPSPKSPVIIRRRKSGHGGHHGGAWKVAYADFVTAMMALFIVLWLMSADKEVQEAVSAYFNNPAGPGKLTGTAAAGLGNALEVPKDDMKKLAEKIQQALLKVPNFRNLKDHVEITITSDGLRIELLETDAGMFFESGRAAPTENGAELLASLAGELGKLPNSLLIEGHTDSKPFSRDGYTNWELSVDRANSARRLMQENGVRPGQVGQVRGYADRQLRHPDDPSATSNRRISVIVQYLSTPADTKAEADGKPSAEDKPGSEPKETKPPDKPPAQGKPQKAAVP
jgi:chemotaxis protein MotB